MGNALAISGDASRVVAIYNDNLNGLRPLLGAPDISRASNVRYDSEREVWVARKTGTEEVLCEHPSRGYCLKQEVLILSKELIDDVNNK